MWIAELRSTKQVIHDADGVPYLIRYFIWRPKNHRLGRIYLHHIVRSDYDRSLHDHPWPFLSLMLKGGYTEVTPSSYEGLTMYDYSEYRAPRVLYRPAHWAHRLVLGPGQTAWTLVFVGPKVREWGFWTTAKSWCYWQHYDYREGICEEPPLETAKEYTL